MENNKPLILVTGSEGLVGSRFLELSKYKSDLHSPKLVELDILKRTELQALLASFDFCSVVNFAAYTDVNGAEKERNNKAGLAWKINVEGVRNLAEVIAPYKNKIQLIQISTDMVFPGNNKYKGPYDENRTPPSNLNDLTWYGYTKLQGEIAVKEILGDDATILRLIYPVRSNFVGKSDYLRKPLELFDQGKLYPVFEDQQMNISFIDDICTTIDKIIETKTKGVLHASSSDLTTPHQLISYMLEKVRGAKNVVQRIKVDDFIKQTGSAPFRYPKYGGLMSDATAKKLSIKFKSCAEIIDELIKQGFGKTAGF